MKYACPLSLLLSTILATQTMLSQNILYRTDEYTVENHRVVQGKFIASAPSDTSLVSSYKSPFATPTKRLIDFKFSLDGLDNELPVGQNHHLVLPQNGGVMKSPVYVFGESESVHPPEPPPADASVLRSDVDLTIRLDMRKVLADFASRGYYAASNGERILAKQFKGVFVAGNTLPLSWDFGGLASHPQFALHDPDGDGVYDIVLRFTKETQGCGEPMSTEWRLTSDLSMFPSLNSPFVLINALYNKSLEELLQNMRSDGALMAGAMWPGVWTRDISYSIILSVAAIQPDAAKISLAAKIKDGKIIQDTGTGGSWPVSSDRMVWALAAWEVYVVTGDRDWLSHAYKIVKKSADQDLHAVYDSTAQLFRGESSFLDWREQTYPRWMDPKDIYESKNLGTNIVHSMSLEVLAKMAETLGQSPEPYRTVSRAVKKSVNEKFWIEQKKYFGQYLYGRTYLSRSPKMEALGEALAVLGGVADTRRASEIIRNTPTTRFGIPCIYPQIPNIPPYHNDAVWPFVESYWGWASARAGNMASVEAALGAIQRASALFLTNKENLVASTGDFCGTEINSSRQLWSVAGNLAVIYRILFGMEFTPDSLSFTPMVPRSYDGEKVLHNFTYRGAQLDIVVKGFGDGVAWSSLDGVKIERAAVPAHLKGRHTIVITMNGHIAPSSITRLDNAFSPETPSPVATTTELHWGPVQGAVKYLVYRNGEMLRELHDTALAVPAGNVFEEFQVKAIDHDGRESFLSQPIVRVPGSAVKIVKPQHDPGNEIGAQAPPNQEFVRLDASQRRPLEFQIHVETAGLFAIDFRYANGNGPINTDNKCAVRTLTVGRTFAGVGVFPQRGVGLWNEWGYSNATLIPLSRGDHRIGLQYFDADENMNGIENVVLIESLRATLIRAEK